MQQVELVRRKVAGNMISEVVRIRSWLSMIDGNNAEIELLRGQQGESLAADLVEVIMRHLGITTQVTREHDGTNGTMSKASRAVRGSLGL